MKTSFDLGLIAMKTETEDQTRLRRAKAVESTRRAKEKYEELFLAEEKRECARRMA